MSEQNEIEDLFPWYVTGALSDADKSKVEHYLTENPQARAQLALIRQERDEVIDMAEQIPGPAAGGVDKLMARLDEEFGPARPGDTYGIVEKNSSSWWQSVINGIGNAFQLPAVRFGAIAAAVVIALQLATIVSLVKSPPGVGGYETASGLQKLGPGPVLLITFKPEATVGQIEALLEKFHGVIIKGPVSGGIYRVHFGREKKTPADTAQLVKSLSAQDKLIAFVASEE